MRLGAHHSKGERKGYYAIKVSRNWRVTFRFEDARPVTLTMEITIEEASSEYA